MDMDSYESEEEELRGLHLCAAFLKYDLDNGRRLNLEQLSEFLHLLSRHIELVKIPDADVPGERGGSLAKILAGAAEEFRMLQDGKPGRPKRSNPNLKTRTAVIGARFYEIRNEEINNLSDHDFNPVTQNLTKSATNKVLAKTRKRMVEEEGISRTRLNEHIEELDKLGPYIIDGMAKKFLT